MVRLNKIRKILDEMNLDGIYITDLYNLRYFAGFTGTTGVALVTKENSFFFSDFRYKSQGAAQVEPMGFQFVEITRGSSNLIWDYAEKSGVKKLGFEDLNLTFSQYTSLKNLYKGELVPLGDKLVMGRMVKGEEEILSLQKAAEISDTAFAEVLKVIREDVSEKELAGYMEYIQRKLGADDRSFDTIFASGERSAMPHGVASDKIVKREGYITMDFGCYYNGYASDMTRTIYFGSKITDRHREIYNTVLEGQLLGIETVKEGIRSDKVDTVVRDFFRSKGLAEYFGHGLGHGLGLEVHELPYLSNMSQIELKENMVVTVEPGLYFEGWGGVRIEDDVVVKKDGCVVLNKSPKELIIVE